jgi:hypothetical protein
VDCLRGLCEEEGWDVAECREVETADLLLDEKTREEWLREVEECRKWIPEMGFEVMDGKTVQRVGRLTSVPRLLRV